MNISCVRPRPRRLTSSQQPWTQTGVGCRGQWSAAGYHAPPRACTRTQGLWRVRGGNLWLDNVDTRTQSHWFIWAPKSRRGLEWLVGAAGFLSLRGLSCSACAPGGLKRDLLTHRRAAEGTCQSTIVVLSCLGELLSAHWGLGADLLTYHWHVEGSCLRTGGLLRAPAKVPLWYYSTPWKFQGATPWNDSLEGVFFHYYHLEKGA